MMKPKGNNNQNKLMRILALPIRALAKARDFYVRSMNNYADRVPYGSGVGPGGYSVPRSFSTSSMRSSQDDDFKELVRAASTNSFGGRRLDLVVHKVATTTTSTTTTRGVPRSASVGMAKIEEDKPCDEFGDVGNTNNDNKDNKDKFRMFPRSKSYALGATKMIPTAF